jgi:hypothetical protein
MHTIQSTTTKSTYSQSVYKGTNYKTDSSKLKVISNKKKKKNRAPNKVLFACDKFSCLH